MAADINSYCLAMPVFPCLVSAQILYRLHVLFPQDRVTLFFEAMSHDLLFFSVKLSGRDPTYSLCSVEGKI